MMLSEPTEAETQKDHGIGGFNAGLRYFENPI
jgi:hypothetical protein